MFERTFSFLALFLILEAGPSLLSSSSLALPSEFKIESVSLAPSRPPEKSRAFQKALRYEPGSRASEQARIDYLLECIANSPYNFFRNGSRYTGKRAEAHLNLKWKYFRYLKKVKTAEDFINKVASYSKMSGEEYLVELPEKKQVPLHPILVRELEIFDQALASRRGAANGTAQDRHL